MRQTERQRRVFYERDRQADRQRQTEFYEKVRERGKFYERRKGERDKDLS